MKLVIYSEILNIHQVHVADYLYELLKDDFCFVELVLSNETKGGGCFNDRPYLLSPKKKTTHEKKAMDLAKTADVCIFAGHHSFKYQKERLKHNKLSFEMGERWLDRGWIKLLSPRLLLNQLYYHTRWYKKPLYKLCCGGYVSYDQYRLHSFNNKCYKWGYFTKVDPFEIEESWNVPASGRASIIWCARFLTWKHPELVVKLAKRLKDDGFDVRFDLYGTGPELPMIEKLRNSLGVSDIVALNGFVPNNLLLKEMRKHDIFLFTSDKMEGWGAVLNEAMSNGCSVVASNEIGSVCYLVKDGENGLVFESGNLDSLYEKVVLLLRNRAFMRTIAINAYYDMINVWSPRNAAKNLIQLISDLQHGYETTIVEGPCSKAPIIKT